MLLIKGNVIMYLRKITETKPFLALTLKKTRGSRGKTTKIYCFCVYALNIDIPYDGKRVPIAKHLRGSRGKTTKLHCFCVHALPKLKWFETVL